MAINMTLDSIRSDVTKEKTLENKVKNYPSLSMETANKIHLFSLEIRPPELDDLGLISALKFYSRKFPDYFYIHINSDDLVKQLDTIVNSLFTASLKNIKPRRRIFVFF